MYIYKLKINNFRSIKELEWKPNKGMNVIIGGNGSGKSSVAVAIDYLLNPNISWYKNSLSEIDFYDRNTDNQVLIEAWVKGVEELTDDNLELLFEHVDQEGNISEFGDDLVLIVRMICDKSMKPRYSIVSNGKEVHFSSIHKQAINFKFISADRDPLKELAFYQNSVLSKTLHNENTSELVQKIIDELDSSAKNHLFNDEKFSDAFKKLKSSFSDFDLISVENDSLNLEIVELSERKTLQAFSLVFKNNEVTKPIPLKYQSRGIKNLLLLVALKDNIDSNSILFLEEIEQNIEPHLQRKIIKSFKNKLENQVFITTHSPEIVKQFDFRNIYLMKSGKIKSIPKIDEVIDRGFEKLVERQAKHEIVSGMFAKGVLLVEGESEKGGLPIFSDVVDYGIEEYGVELIYCNGKSNLVNYTKFYESIDIPVISLLDNDSDIQSDLNKLKGSKCPIFLVPEDYEGSIVTSKSFQEKFKEIFESQIPFDRYKDNYLNPFKINKPNIKNGLLKEFYLRDKEKIDNARCIEDIIKHLSHEELKEYQKIILHSHLANVPSAREVAWDIVDDLENRDEEEVIPATFRNIFRLANNYIANKCLCEEENCIVLSFGKLDAENVCKRCAEIKNGYSNVLEVRGE